MGLILMCVDSNYNSKVFKRQEKQGLEYPIFQLLYVKRIC